MAATLPPEIIDDPNRDYGAKIAAVEPGGVEFIPLDERHGSPVQLFWTWTSPNMEFATVGVGILGPLAFGLSFWHSVLAILIGTAVGSGTQGILSTWGPRAGLPQMVIGRTAFGFLGNALPAGLNALVAGVGWFAVNSISGALALHALFDDLPKWLCLLVVVVAELVLAVYGHNLVQAVERVAFPLLFVIFVIVSIWVLTKTHPSVPPSYAGGVGGFLIMVGATFGYAVGWNPYASDYTRYLPRDTPRAPVGIWAGLGLFWSCSLLEIAGAGVVTAGKTALDPSSFTDLVPTWLGKLTLLAVVIGAVCANALNMYSGSLSFMAVGFRLPTRSSRAAVAVVLGVAGTILSYVFLNNTTGAYENFLLVISYWIGPWLGIVFLDRVLRRGTDSRALFVDTR
ncbi:cytosine permease, partial [Jatrophihabitans endophyticus]|uniref:purine-cytosine permease family protein n=1 Tax=Jatrophihabitans endophyticus TaxID=1206085 RepID=UPI0019F4E434